MDKQPYALKDLEGSALTDIGHAVDMICLHFDKGGQEYALHVQCPYRLIHREKVILTRSSYYISRDPDADYDDRDTLFHALVKDNVRPILPLRVTQVDITPHHDLCIRMDGETRLEVFAEFMPGFEQWRLFLADERKLPHMVADGNEIVFE